ncbi:OmpA family protein [Hymenobacter cellulosilyticus]|uniref:OmpA family protein n=1 Tax=Hymenobacter cellulosilyticus TaxID=2932248 RepID=A0A8T9Q127_9BACT|nr:OmpA family protein [Hymenobacter cellulosilyticus]UOQ71466.1 OmpA family protein [Hymenobacter cellulosilyticus]
MSTLHRSLAAACASLLLGTACSSDTKPATAAVPAPAPAVAAVATVPAAATAPATSASTPSNSVGFDPATAPIATPTLGAFPYFSLLDGYVKMDEKTAPGNSAREFNKDTNFDRYEFFDGAKLIPVEGRLRTVSALGKTASFFQAQKTYEKLVRDLGGVTVFEGSGQKMKELKLKYEDPRHRSRYGMTDQEKSGVYLLRTPDKEVWVEVYKTYSSDPENYWLTVVEKKVMPMEATVLPAAEMKKALDINGHVALYLNFDTDQATLKPDAQAIIAQIISLLSQNPDLKLAVQGHTDDAGTPAHNQELSEARARTVVATLTAQGIAPARLQAAGFGQTKPLTDNTTEVGKAKNRRVELVKL